MADRRFDDVLPYLCEEMRAEAAEWRRNYGRFRDGGRQENPRSLFARARLSVSAMRERRGLPFASTSSAEWWETYQESERLAACLPLEWCDPEEWLMRRV